MYDESHAREWYEEHGISDDDWNSYDTYTKRIISIEAVCDDWPEVIEMREVGMGPQAVTLYIDPAEARLDKGELQHHATEDGDYESLTAYVMQHSSRNINNLFTNSSVTVESVSFKNEVVRIEVAPSH